MSRSAPRAGHHCRHYGYSLEMADMGPRCAKAIDLSGPGASRCCWPNPTEVCTSREDWSDEERAASALDTQRRTERLFNAMLALPRPIPLGTRGEVECPNCGGALHYARWERGAALHCSTDDCCGARMSIAAGADWPVLEERTNG